MIPRLRPTLGLKEALALLPSFREDDVERFERTFAQTLGVDCALAYPYGRSALWSFLRAVGLHGDEVILPTYTCTVVAHAIVLSGNVPRFVDIERGGFLADLDQVEAQITSRTRAIVVTHLFGYPADLERLTAILARAEEAHGHQIWVVQDCAHSFGCGRPDRPVQRAPDVALFGLNASKLVTSIFGGVLTTEDPHLAERLRRWRSVDFHRNPLKGLRRAAYAAALFVAFDRRAYRGVKWLQDHTSLLDGATRAYHLDGEIRLPPDYREELAPIEARVGLAQLERYPWMVARRREIAARYRAGLSDLPGVELPPEVEGATYSHYVLRVADRPRWIMEARRAGIELGTVIDYSVAELPAYARYRDRPLPRAQAAAEQALNLPIHPSLGVDQVEAVISCIRGIATRGT